jgi:hypothetical protein
MIHRKVQNSCEKINRPFTLSVSGNNIAGSKATLLQNKE